MFDIVVAADLEWGIGKAGALPWPRLRGDLQHFKRVTTTLPSAVVMGRGTWESAEVAGKPLPKRFNLVVTRRADLALPDGVVAAPSLDTALAAARVPGVEAVFVVGGAELFRHALEHSALRWVYLTRVAGRFDCDAKISDLDRGFARSAWDGEQALEDNGVRYRIERLTRRPGT